MTASRLLRRTRARLVAVLVFRAIGTAAAVALLVLAVGAAIAAAVATPDAWMPGVRLAAVLGAVAATAVVAWRGRFALSLPRVALWIEERAPHLQYALVSAADPRCAGLAARLESSLAGLEPGSFVRRAAQRSILPPAVAVLIAAVVLAVLPPARVQLHGSALAAGAVGEGVAERSRLSPLRAQVLPPAYAQASGLAAEELDEPATIAGLAGSTVVIHGQGRPDGIGVRLGADMLDVSADGDDWTASFTLPDSALALQLTDREFTRLLVLAPRIDELPRAQLLQPVRDTTLREAAGTLTLDARLSDDLGIASAWFEYIVTSGEGEGTFTFREGRIGERGFDGGTTAALRAAVPFSMFRLDPGDRLSVRAAVRDNNTHSGPGTGYSETRLLRVSRPGEYDSLAVEGAPPAVDSTLMTLRYLIVLTEEVHERRDVMERQAFVDTAVGLGRTTERLRNRVRSLQADQTMGGLFEGNPLLDVAHIELVQGAAALRVAEPGIALPHLREALRVLEEYAMAERYYTRGGTPDVLVDLARVRLSGKDPGRAAGRTAREQAEAHRRSLRARFSDALALLPDDADGAMELLVLLQVDALRTDAELAGALAAAVGALRDGGDAERPLLQARWLLEGRATRTPVVHGWSGSW